MSKRPSRRTRRRGQRRQREALRRAARRKSRARKPKSPLHMSRAYRQGYEDGLRNGGEALLEAVLPLDVLIPGITPEAAMRAGVAALRKQGYPVLFPPAVFAEIDSAIKQRRPFSFVRLGDGELLTLAQKAVLSDQEIRRVGSYLPSAGVNIPDLDARDKLIRAVKSASLVGVPMSRMPYFQPLFVRVAQAHGIDIASLRLTTSTMNFSLDDHGLLMKLLAGRKVLVIGNTARQLAEVLRARGVDVAGAIAPVRGVQDAARVTAEAAKADFDLALVAAGIAAVPICADLAALTGKAALDIGSLANRLTGIRTY